MSAQPPPLPARPPLPALVDFGDWLSPMIVKELRQGLRTWVFVGAFIVLQAVLVMTLMISTSSGNLEAASSFFWFLVAFILVFIVPLRGFNALAGEIKAQTLDALVLTRLSAFRIAFGKWAALVLQSGLIAVSVLPYVVLRYFGGGIDLVNELRALLLFWMLSAAVTSVAVACSAMPSVIIRMLALMATWWWAGWACTALIVVTTNMQEREFFGISLTESFWLILLAVFIPLWIYGCYFVIEMGASAIAPMAANHATRKRLISLVFMLVTLGFVFGLGNRTGQQVAFSCLIAIWALSSVDCLTETPATAVSVYAPFVKRRLPGQLAALFLTPGWATGLLFFLLSSTLVFIGWSGKSHLYSPSYVNVIAAGNAAGCALAPLALALLCFRPQPRMLGPYLLCGLILVIFGALLMFMTKISGVSNVAYAGMVSPPTTLMAAAAAGSSEREAILVGGLVSTLLSLAIILLKAFPHYRAISAAMREVDAAMKS